MVQRFLAGSDWFAAHPPAPERLTQSLAGVARRVRSGEDFHPVVQDAYLGALAEHLAVTHGLERPSWSVEPDRFLPHFWFVSETPGFRAISIAQAPAAFRRRNVFVPERSLHRV